MIQITFGNRKVGVQAVFYFDNHEEAQAFGEDEKCWKENGVFYSKY